MNVILLLLHYFFIVSHIAIILFTLLGWIFKRTRKAHFIFIVLTLFSWLILGMKYGYGYCFWTDWHWQIRQSLGEKNLPYSFVEYLLESITGIDWNTKLVDWMTASFLLITGSLSLYFNFCKASSAGREDSQ